MNTRRGRVASGLTHPIPVLAIGVLLLNDHWLKSEWGHPLTGKLSDVAGLLFFPLLLVALVEVSQAASRHYRGPSRRLLMAAVVATGVVFALVQVFPPMTEVYRVTLAALQRPAVALEVFLDTGGFAAMPQVTVTPDASDLLALPALAVAYAIGLRGVRTSGR